MTGCSALGLLPVACASVGWQRAREAGVERPVLVSGQGRGGLTGAACLLSDKLLAASRHWLVSGATASGAETRWLEPATGTITGKQLSLHIYSLSFVSKWRTVTVF